MTKSICISGKKIQNKNYKVLIFISLEVKFLLTILMIPLISPNDKKEDPISLVLIMS